MPPVPAVKCAPAAPANSNRPKPIAFGCLSTPLSSRMKPRGSAAHQAGARQLRLPTSGLSSRPNSDNAPPSRRQTPLTRVKGKRRINLNKSIIAAPHHPNAAPVNRRGSTEPKDAVGSPARHPREYSTLPGGKICAPPANYGSLFNIKSSCCSSTNSGRLLGSRSFNASSK